ncbi:MAG TPA: SMI1/KNR4 family protein [Saprospiraceae bacterium]|nr:SMI1/KNR4 family protein [Saprospiraceae bacterium]
MIENLIEIESYLKISFPTDYLNYIENNIGVYENEYNIVDFWSLFQILNMEKKVNYSSTIPNYVVIGTNLSGTALLLNRHDQGIFVTEFIGMDEDYIIKIANNFTEFIQKFNNGRIEDF